MICLEIATFLIFAMIPWINCDICDVCLCSKNDYNPENDSSIGACVGQSDEQMFCSGSDEKFKTDRMKFNLNSIPWPKKNGSISATFNHFDFPHLSKYDFFLHPYFKNI